MCLRSKISVEELVCGSLIDIKKYDCDILPNIIDAGITNNYVGITNNYVVLATKKVGNVSLYVVRFDEGTFWYFGYTKLTGVLLIDVSRDVNRIVNNYIENVRIGWINEQFDYRNEREKEKEKLANSYWWWCV
jgi:hypothetical protein